MKQFKTFFIVLVLFMAAPLVYVIVHNMKHDALEIFVKDKEFYPFLHSKYERYSIAGIARHYDIDNIIVGSSLAQNIIPSEVEDVMKWGNVFSLTASAILIREISQITEHALERQDIQNVIFPLRLNILAHWKPDYELNKRINPDFMGLYDSYPWNDFVLFTHKNPQEKLHKEKHAYRNAIKDMLGEEATEERIFKASKDLFSPWMRLYKDDFNRPLIISSVSVDRFKPMEMTESVRDNINYHLSHFVEPLLEKYPETNFYFVLPPMTFVKSKRFKEIFPETLAIVVKRLSQYKNAKIYNFLDNDFNADLRLFKDFAHAHIEVSRYMLQSLATGRDLVTAENVDAQAALLGEKIKSYEMPKIWYVPKRYTEQTTPYPKKGCLRDYDAAGLVWGDDFTPSLFAKIPRSPFLNLMSSLDHKDVTFPPLDATREQLEMGCDHIVSD